MAAVSEERARAGGAVGTQERAAAGRGAQAAAGYDVERVRAEFPALARRIDGEPLVFLDSAASAQKPRAVLDAVERASTETYANVHRGVYRMAAEATAAYEGVRGTVARFLGAGGADEIVFVRGATEAINLVAASWGKLHVGPGDEVLLTEMEHHANIVPWQLLCEERGARLAVAPVTDAGELDLDAFGERLSERTRIVAVTHVSNVLGTVNPIPEIVRLAHDAGAKVLVDGAQGVVHLPVDVAALGCDFYVFSGHKLYAPTGSGVLWGRRDLLEAMPPWQGGGDMIRSVSFEGTTFKAPPHRFEAGTPDFVAAIGLGAAIDYVSGLGLEAIAAHEHALLAHAGERLAEVPGLTIYGRAPGKAAVVSMDLEGVHPHDVATVLDSHGIAVRAGHHCAQPLMERFGLAATARASFGLYNTVGEVDALAEALLETRRMFG